MYVVINPTQPRDVSCDPSALCHQMPVSSVIWCIMKGYFLPRTYHLTPSAIRFLNIFLHFKATTNDNIVRLVQKPWKSVLEGSRGKGRATRAMRSTQETEVGIVSELGSWY